jgi:hypothetical protein
MMARATMSPASMAPRARKNLPTNPLSPGMPTSASEPTVNAPKVQGIRRPSPPVADVLRCAVA